MPAKDRLILRKTSSSAEVMFTTRNGQPMRVSRKPVGTSQGVSKGQLDGLKATWELPLVPTQPSGCSSSTPVAARVMRHSSSSSGWWRSTASCIAVWSRQCAPTGPLLPPAHALAGYANYDQASEPSMCAT